MEAEVCKFGKFGFCKFKESCKRKHFVEICESQSKCKDIKECQKRHPKPCRRFTQGNECRFKEDCAYNHTDSIQDKEKNDLKEKVENLEKTVIELTKKGESVRLEPLEKVVHALTRKVLELECIIKDMKNKTVRDKVLNETPIAEESSFDHNDIKHSSSTPKENNVKEGIQKLDTKEDIFKCKECNYKSKKEIYLKKHITNNHGDHRCNVCKEKLPTFMELLKHVSKNHYKEDDPPENISEGDACDNKSKVSMKDKFKCEKCDYTCKMEETLKKHTNTKHAD
jgi:hypothetical protein